MGDKTGPSGPLDGVRVVEYGSSISGPYCSKMMADMGADVIKVEPPFYGDEARIHGPFPGDVPDRERSGLFLFLNSNKRGISLDPGNPAGRGILLELLRWADVFVENRPVSETRELGLEYETLKQENPRLIVTSVTPYGRTGPYKDYKGCDLTANAAGGFSFGNGHPHREPLTTPAYQASFMAGVTAALATTIALVGRDISGEGQLVDVSESQVIAVILTGYHLPTYIYRGIAGWRSGNRMRLGLFPNCVLPCKDGYVCIDCPQMEQYQRFLHMIGDPEWTEDPKFRNRRAMTEEYPEEAEALITPWFMEHTKAEIMEMCMENRVPCVPVRTIDDVMNSEHMKERDFFHELDHPKAGALKYPGAPIRFQETPWKLVRPAPTLGQHNREIICGQLGHSPEDLTLMRRTGII